MSYKQDVRDARERYESALTNAVDEAAADAVRIAEEHARKLLDVSKEIAGKDWKKVHAKATLYARSPEKRARDSRQGTLRSLRALARREPDMVAREVAKVVPVETTIHVAAEVSGQTRRSAPSNKAKVEEVYGPAEFNRLEDAIDDVLERLPDLATNKANRDQAVDLADKAEAVAGTLRAFARGEDVGSEVEEWLQSR